MAAINIDDNGRQKTVYVAGSSGDVWAFHDGHVYRQRAQPGPPEGAGPAKAGHYELNSPMPATVIKILVEPGQTVCQGDTLIVVEAMKMELPIRAPQDGVVSRVACKEGDLVSADAVLVELA